MRRVRMPVAKSGVVAALAVSCIVACHGTALSFHSGGSGECEGCHTIHNSIEGTPMARSGLAGKYLLKGNDPTTVCLNCHEGDPAGDPARTTVSTPSASLFAGFPPVNYTPGGDFGWLKKSFTWLPSATEPLQASDGDRHGHNVVAPDYGYNQDATKGSAPGGSYPSQSLTCISCHDPHGRYRRTDDFNTIATTGSQIIGSGSTTSSPSPTSFSSVGVYRLLGGVGYYPKSLGPAFSFTANPPAALAPDAFNRSEEISPTRVAYGAGMSDWCRNCHPASHLTVQPGSPTRHPSGAPLGTTVSGYYNAYLRDGNPLSGTENTAYLSLVPFEIGTSDYGRLRGILSANPLKGPSSLDGTPQVMCLSCHRAHASGWDSAIRWNNGSPYIVTADSAGVARYDQAGELYQPYGQGRSKSEAAGGYYGTTATSFGTPQRPLCFKCHDVIPVLPP